MRVRIWRKRQSTSIYLYLLNTTPDWLYSQEEKDVYPAGELLFVHFLSPVCHPAARYRYFKRNNVFVYLGRIEIDSRRVLGRGGGEKRLAASTYYGV